MLTLEQIKRNLTIKRQVDVREEIQPDGQGGKKVVVVKEITLCPGQISPEYLEVWARLHFKHDYSWMYIEPHSGIADMKTVTGTSIDKLVVCLRSELERLGFEISADLPAVSGKKL